MLTAAERGPCANSSATIIQGMDPEHKQQRHTFVYGANYLRHTLNLEIKL